MQEFEEQTLLSAKNLFEEFVYKLGNIGLVLDIRLAWCNRGEEDKDNYLIYSRIEYSNTYMCNLEIIVRKKEDPQFDLDLQCLCYINPITQGSIYLWRPGIKLSKMPEKYLTAYMKQAKAGIQRVLDEGYETVLEDVKELDK